MNVWNFTFGSHLSTTQFGKIIAGAPLKMIPASLPGYRLSFAKVLQWPADCADLATGGGPCLIADEGSKISGIAYQITESQFKIIDGYEKAWGYIPIEVTVQTDGGLLNANAHNLVAHGGFTSPAESFLTLMLGGLREHGYGEQIVQQIKQAASIPK